jgi:hypothetical protein
LRSILIVHWWRTLARTGSMPWYRSIHLTRRTLRIERHLMVHVLWSCMSGTGRNAWSVGHTHSILVVHGLGRTSSHVDRRTRERGIPMSRRKHRLGSHVGRRHTGLFGHYDTPSRWTIEQLTFLNPPYGWNGGCCMPGIIIIGPGPGGPSPSSIWFGPPGGHLAPPEYGHWGAGRQHHSTAI